MHLNEINSDRVWDMMRRTSPLHSVATKIRSLLRVGGSSVTFPRYAPCCLFHMCLFIYLSPTGVREDEGVGILTSEFDAHVRHSCEINEFATKVDAVSDTSALRSEEDKRH